jgi:cytochrome c-type biogenesis protein CcmE
MLQRKQRFIVGISLVLIAFGYLAVSGFEEGKSYYILASDLAGMGERAYGLRLRVAGDVVAGSIERDGFITRFRIEQAGTVVPVVYSGKDPLPDTFTDESKAVVEGTYGRDGVFEAKKVQAKCASKYEAEYDPSQLEPKGPRGS